MDKKVSRKETDIVSQDRNWVLRINSELQSENKWGSQWGHLSGKFSPQKQKQSVGQRIQQLQQQVKELDGDLYAVTSNSYGHGQDLEAYRETGHNITVNKDLRALERRLPKGWKKPKWTPPPDPYNPLNQAKKK